MVYAAYYQVCIKRQVKKSLRFSVIIPGPLEAAARNSMYQHREEAYLV